MWVGRQRGRDRLLFRRQAGQQILDCLQQLRRLLDLSAQWKTTQICITSLCIQTTSKQLSLKTAAQLPWTARNSCSIHSIIINPL